MARKNKTAPAKRLGLPADYPGFLESLKARVRQAQTKAMLSSNRELIALYWDIGRRIVERQEREGWGKRVVDRLAADIQQAFPGIRGFSPGNVWRMRAFFLAYRSTQPILTQPARELAHDTKVAQAVRKLGESLLAQTAPKSKCRSLAQAARETAESIQSQVLTELNVPILPQAVAEIPWYHNVILLEKVKDADQRLWYAAKTLEHGWSRAVLTVQIESDLYGRQGKAISNFAGTLPAPQSDLAQQSLKDPYVFDFLTLHSEAVERELESGLVAHIQRFLLELGAGFAFVGRQANLPSIEEIEAELEFRATGDER